jgi:hypothetical protein
VGVKENTMVVARHDLTLSGVRDCLHNPSIYANYGGNVTPEIIGLENFEQYYVPHYNEAAEVMHKHGKLIGCHFDANCRLLAKAIAQTNLDYIEAFTPAPDTDMTLGDARQAWPDKVLWLNFPSSVHLRSDAEIEQTTVDLLNQVETVDGLLMGIMEDIPAHRWQKSCRAIMDGLDRHARENPHVTMLNFDCHCEERSDEAISSGATKQSPKGSVVR